METPACRHHWDIESPSGAQSEGRCRYCGETRMFDNVLSDWGPGDAPAQMLPPSVVREMAGYMRVASALTFAGHNKPRGMGRDRVFD